MRAYSTDLRTKILAAVDGGMSKSDAARVFRVGISTIKRYAQQRRQTGSLAPRPIPGRPPTFSRDDDSALWAHLEAHPDALLPEQCAVWEQSQGMRVSPSTMGRAIRRLGWTRQKRRWWPPRGGPSSGLSGTPSCARATPAASSSSTRAPRLPA
jgi:transposase